jgi:hypothetical protein
MFGLSTTATIGIGVVLACVLFAFAAMRKASTHNTQADKLVAQRKHLAAHNTTIRVCVRAERSQASPLARTIHQALRLATSPARVHFAVVAHDPDGDVRQRYTEIAGPTNSHHARRIQTFYVMADEDQGWLQDWNLWHTKVSDGETIVLVLDMQRFSLQKGWDVEVERIAQAMPSGHVFTASGTRHFPCLKEGVSDHRYFPRVVPQEFVMRKGPFTPAIAVDKGLMVFSGMTGGPCHIHVEGRCSALEADVALSEVLFQRGFKFVSAPCPWVGDQSDILGTQADAEVAAQYTPAAADRRQHEKAVRLGANFLEFAGLEEANDGVGARTAVLYDIGIRARMGLTKNFQLTQERLRKYGTQSKYSQARRWMLRDL